MIRPRRWGNGRRSVDCIGGIMSRFSLTMTWQAFGEASLCGPGVQFKVRAGRSHFPEPYPSGRSGNYDADCERRGAKQHRHRKQGGNPVVKLSHRSGVMDIVIALASAIALACPLAAATAAEYPTRTITLVVP